MIYFVAVLVGLAIGSLFGMQPSINGTLGASVEHPLQASLILICVATGTFPPRFVSSPGQLPWWIWTGGAIGVAVVTGTLVLAPRVGSLTLFVAFISGQVLTALVIDHFGWLGNPRIHASPMRLLGAGLLLAGLTVIVVSKKSESRAAGPDHLERSNEPSGIDKNHG
ncbi:DMT family transporter [Rubripirellula amarantea]|nr:DMT family transporter [Rubripirellula amarantea]